MRFWSSSPSKHSGKEGKMQIIETTGNLFRALHRQGGYTSNEERIAAIRDMPRPTNVKELRSFSWTNKLLLQIHCKPTPNVQQVVRVHTVRDKVEMVRRLKNHCSRN